MQTLVLGMLVLQASVRGAAAEPALDADTILARAIDVQQQHEEHGNEVKYDYDLVSVTEKLDNTGDVKKVEEELYRSHHIDGLAYERLVAKDGRELTDKELKKRAQSVKRSFARRIAEGEAKHNDADDRVAFDEELLSRYDIDLVGIRPISGRDCYVLVVRAQVG